VTYNGFYDSNLEWVGLEGVQIVASMNAGTGLGRHKLTSRFTSVVRNRKKYFEIKAIKTELTLFKMYPKETFDLFIHYILTGKNIVLYTNHQIIA
jgi:hypothetical protein